MEEMTREQLEQEIASTQEALDSKKAELDAVRDQLGKEPVDVEAGVKGTDGGTDEGSAEGAIDNAELESLQDQELKLSEEVLVLQARLVALHKMLNDAISNEAMDKIGEEE